jgi:hypothetical protein
MKSTELTDDDPIQQFIKTAKQLKIEHHVEFLSELPAQELRLINKIWKQIHKDWLNKLEMDPYCQAIREKHKKKALKNRKGRK